MSKLYDILNSMITRLKKVETTESDWNASEGEAGHVKNRTHWVEDELMFDGEITTHDVGSTTKWISTQGEINIELVEAETYTVVFNGTTYKCEATSDGYGGLFIGDYNLWMNMSETAELPFCYGNGWFGTAEVGTYIVVIKCGLYHKIDEQFLPEQCNEIVFTAVPNDDGWYDYTCNKSYAKVSAMLKTGATARMILVNGNKITHLVLQYAEIRDTSVIFNFFDINDMENTDGCIKYKNDGTIGGGLE